MLSFEKLNAIGLKKEAGKSLGVVEGSEILVQVALKCNTGNFSQVPYHLLTLCILTLSDHHQTQLLQLQYMMTCSMMQKEVK